MFGDGCEQLYSRSQYILDGFTVLDRNAFEGTAYIGILRWASF